MYFKFNLKAIFILKAMYYFTLQMLKVACLKAAFFKRTEKLVCSVWFDIHRTFRNLVSLR